MSKEHPGAAIPLLRPLALLMDNSAGHLTFAAKIPIAKPDR
jgi:hypothetical protein